MKNQIKLGDMIAKLSKTLGIPHCPKCEQRRLILNEIEKYGIRETLRKMSALGKNENESKEEDLKKIIKKLNDCCN